MPFIGNAPARVPLTSADITDGIITNADIASGAAIAQSKIAGSFGKVLQVVSATTSSSVATSSQSFVTTGLTANITPSSTSNKILILCQGGEINTEASGRDCQVTIYKSSTNLGNGNAGMGTIYGASSRIHGIPSIGYLDSPSTTSSTTYAMYFRSGGGSSVTFDANACLASIILLEIAG